ncbi:MAG: CTP-dependent riboflavin kinase [Candidatus Aenigmatarchaeota archaeon]|nr:MAG: CTP-dependent riboflavin kinase [Candidatus Aenigmarchaeota archaeon]
MKTDVLDVMVELSRRKGKVTTDSIARKLGSSQQTISRKIRELESRGMITRTSHPKGQFISLTIEGMRFLRKRYLELRDVIERSKESGISFGGHLISGSGEGRYYVGQDEYFLQFHDKLGFRPFLGTLNIRLKTTHDINAKNEMEKIKPVVVEGFKKEKRTFGDIRCYPCIVNRRTRGAIVIPERSHHPSDVIEVIAPVYIRNTLSLKDNDYVHVEVRS